MPAWVFSKRQLKHGSVANAEHAQGRSLAKPDPKKKGIAIKVTPKKGQGSRKSWRELSSDEGEEYKRKVDSAREVKILPGKTRSGAGQDAVYSEDESESTENEKMPQQKTRKNGSKQTNTTCEDSNPLGSDADSHVSTPGKNFDADYPERSADAGSHVSTPGKNINADYPESPTYISVPYNNSHDSRYAEDSKWPINVQTPPTPAPGSDCWSEDSDDTSDVNANAKRGAVEGEPASLAEDSTKESTQGSNLVSKDSPIRSSRPTTPEAASTLLSIASSMTVEAQGCRTSGPVTHTKGDQALMAALRGSWVSHYFAQISED